MTKVETNIKNIAKLTKVSYEEYIDANTHKNSLSPAKISLPKTIRNEIFKLGNKFGAVFYGTFVSTNQIQMRKTYDFDMYIPQSNMMNFLETIRKKFPKTTLQLNAYGMWKVKINNQEIADIGYLEQVKKNKDGTYTITSAPLNIRSKLHPLVKYGKSTGRTLEVEHLAKANASLFDTQENRTHRYAKDTYDFGVMNRSMIIKLFDTYKKQPTQKLKNHINKLVREIVLYSSNKEVLEARTELEKQLLATKMVNFKLYDTQKNTQLLALKRQLRNPNFDITKNMKYLEYFKPSK
ncbi:MAG: glycine--tRNA ligase subunit alpha [Clostridia bacterium]|jgi:glycyl-tRNA synthetase alpha subunit|nr:glycine--tRNA ligase subunit alpha [Clostridia bacterium]